MPEALETDKRGRIEAHCLIGFVNYRINAKSPDSETETDLFDSLSELVRLVSKETLKTIEKYHQGNPVEILSVTLFGFSKDRHSIFWVASQDGFNGDIVRKEGEGARMVEMVEFQIRIHDQKMRVIPVNHFSSLIQILQQTKDLQSIELLAHNRKEQASIHLLLQANRLAGELIDQNPGVGFSEPQQGIYF